MAVPNVDVIIPVYNSLHVVRPCVESVLRGSSDYRLLLVDDGSDRHTAAQLAEWATASPQVELLTNPRNLGFVRTCNRAFASTEGEIVVVLNSDTAVPPGWLDKVRACFASDPRIGVASPVSNFAPHMRVDPLPGSDYLQMAAVIESLGPATYPDITTPEGFCFAISRRCLDLLEGFDEVFDDGYGEESDFSMRANYHGFRTVLIDDLYVFHRGRATFGVELRDRLYNRNKKVFHDRWGQRYPQDFQAFMTRDPLARVREGLNGLRSPELEPVYRR